MSSGAGVEPFPGLGTYGSTKAALRLAGMVLAAELDMRAAGGAARDATSLGWVIAERQSPFGRFSP